jgi:hypothetical protein
MFLRIKVAVILFDKLYYLTVIFQARSHQNLKTSLNLFLPVRLVAPMDHLNSHRTNFREIYIRNLCCHLATSSAIKNREKKNKSLAIKTYKCCYYLGMTDLYN